MQQAADQHTDTVEAPRGEEGALSADFVRAVEEALSAGERERVRALVADLHEADQADLLELLRPEQRSALIDALGPEFRAIVLSELEEGVRDQLLGEMGSEQVAEAVRELESDDAVYLLEDLEAAEQSEILARLPESERTALERSLEYPEDSAGRLMQADVIAVPPFWSVGQTIDYMRETEDLPEAFSEIYVVNPKFHLRGRVPLSRLLRTKRPVLIRDIMETDPHAVPATLDQEEVARLFEHYNLLSAPVVDEDGRLVGVITVDDVVDVIHEEAQEDIHRLGGVGDEALTDTVLRIARSRFTWLLINLATALLASAVIRLFDATIEQMVALAVLMPIVASMGGNAATQTMTVAVRALATRELGSVNAMRIVIREALVGWLNGLVFAAIMGLIAMLWFDSGPLGYTIAAAMLVNHVIAALAGILIPLALDRMNVDPAVASSVFVTTVTDVVGFFAFLGLAALWLV